MRVLTALAAALTLAACGHEAEDQAKAPPLAGERLVVRERTIADVKPVSAAVATRDTGEARARIGGVLTRLAVKEGDFVRKGQMIALVTDQRLTFETRAYQAQAAAAAAEAQNAAVDYQRIKTLYDKGIYAKARLDQAEAANASAQQMVRAAREQSAAAAELGAQGAILAPTDGRVLRADTPVGSVVMPGQTVATVTAGDPVLRLEVPEAQGSTLRVGQQVAIEPGDLPGASIGVIDRVYPAVTAGQVSADIKVAGLQPDFVGRRVRVRLGVGERPALVVPRRFIATRYGVDFVTVIGEGGAPAEVAVQLAPGPTDAEAEVLSGLVAGDVLLRRAAK